MNAGILSFGIHRHRAVKPCTALYGDKHYWLSETEKLLYRFVLFRTEAI
jgi:hypothetical protein